MHHPPETTRRRSRAEKLWAKSRLFVYRCTHEPDRASLIAIAVAVAYMFYFMPGALGAAFFASLIAVCFRLFQVAVEQTVGTKLPVKPQYIGAFVLGIVIVTQVLGAGPVFAQFFESLEEATVNVIDEADTGISEDFIRTIFLFFRVIVILAFLVGVIVAFGQATRGNDWQPIAQLVGIGIAFVIGVELISRLILGPQATAGGGDGGGG